MNALKKLYKEFFGITEQAKPGDKSMFHVGDEDVANMQKMAQAAQQLKNALGEQEIDEAQLVNHIADYRGGVEYVLRDPATAQNVANDIRDWAERKGFTIVKQNISKSGKVGYFYFRLGEDPGRESQKIQGYIAQVPEIKHFRFNVRGQRPQPEAPAPEAPQAI